MLVRGARACGKREALWQRMLQLTSEWVICAALMDCRQRIGVGPKVADHSIPLLPVYVLPAWEDVRVKSC
jgi:hypothetical protein